MRIAVLGWGSLLWDRRSLAIDGAFQLTDLVLPLEFSRVSRDGRLTLVIDEACGVPCATHVGQSAHVDLAGAVKNLAVREGMRGTDGKGFLELAIGRQSAGDADEPDLPAAQGI